MSGPAFPAGGIGATWCRDERAGRSRPDGCPAPGNAPGKAEANDPNARLRRLAGGGRLLLLRLGPAGRAVDHGRAADARFRGRRCDRRQPFRGLFLGLRGFADSLRPVHRPVGAAPRADSRDPGHGGRLRRHGPRAVHRAGLCRPGADRLRRRLRLRRQHGHCRPLAAGAALRVFQRRGARGRPGRRRDRAGAVRRRCRGARLARLYGRACRLGPDPCPAGLAADPRPAAVGRAQRAGRRHAGNAGAGADAQQPDPRAAPAAEFPHRRLRLPDVGADPGLRRPVGRALYRGALRRRYHRGRLRHGSHAAGRRLRRTALGPAERPARPAQAGPAGRRAARPGDDRRCDLSAGPALRRLPGLRVPLRLRRLGDGDGVCARARAQRRPLGRHRARPDQHVHGAERRGVPAPDRPAARPVLGR